MVMLNGTILGVHRQPVHFAQAFRRLRRSNRVGEFVSIYIQQDVCYIASDGGRYSSHMLTHCPLSLLITEMLQPS